MGISRPEFDQGDDSTPTVEEVRRYWDSNLNLTQFLEPGSASPGDPDLFRRLRVLLDRYEYKKPLFRRFASRHPSGRLLEVGCGLGLELAYLGRLGFSVTGIDLAPRAVQVAREHLRETDVPGQVFVDNAERLSFPDESFDAVYSSGVLQHTPDIASAVDEIRRVLRPSGEALVILYHRRSWFYLLQRLSGISVEFESDDAPIVHAYTQSEVRRLFAEFSETDVACRYYRPLPTRRRGALAILYNRVFVPVVRNLPDGLMRHFGWHLVVSARK